MIDLALPSELLQTVWRASADDWRQGISTLTLKRLKPALVFSLGFFAARQLLNFAVQWRAARAARRAAERAGKPKPKKRERSKWAGLWLLAGLFSVAGVVLGLCYHRYGRLFFVPGDQKRLDLSADAWRELLETRSVAFVGGHHRAGTTALWRAVAAHPRAASFGEQHECALDFSEGIFAQDVYPRFGVGEVQGDSPLSGILSAKDKAAMDTGGLGRYALGPVEDVYWTESHWTVNNVSQARVLNAFGFYWDRQGAGMAGADVLLEKSPPNAILARYLQALVDWPDVAKAPPPACAASGTCTKDEEFGGPLGLPFKPPHSRARFVFVARHPIANAVSHSLVLRDATLPALVAHWIAVATYAKVNEGFLAYVLSVKFEDFCADPAAGVAELWDFLGLSPEPELAATVAKAIRKDPNAKHKASYCGPVTAGDAFARGQHALIADQFGDRIEAEHGYTVRAWCDVDGY